MLDKAFTDTRSSLSTWILVPSALAKGKLGTLRYCTANYCVQLLCEACGLFFARIACYVTFHLCFQWCVVELFLASLHILHLACQDGQMTRGGAALHRCVSNI